jgi:hypothetical protein
MRDLFLEDFMITYQFSPLYKRDKIMANNGFCYLDELICG